MKRGLFGGTFDPIHFGHLNLAISLKESAHLDEVWVVPARRSPLKPEEETAPDHHRLEMVKRAFDGIPGFIVSDIELTRPAPSYTIDTLEQIGPCALMLGEDAFAHLDRWKEAKKILETVPLLVGCRQGENQKNCIQIPQMEISATDIRQRLKKRLYCGHLVPAKVLDYIYENQLYSSS